MKINLKFLTLIFLSLALTTYAEKNLTFQIIPSQNFLPTTKVTLTENDRDLGFMYYSQIPFLNIYIFHTLYIFSEHRHQGNAQYVLKNTLKKLQKQGVTTIYIQPGPFEIKSQTTKNIDQLSREEKIILLVALYQKCGFQKTDATTQFLANIVYKMLNIPENSQYLMVTK